MNKLSQDTTAAIVDGILKFIAAGGFLTTALIAPNALQIFDKPPLSNLLKDLDDRSRKRELGRIAHYMKQKGLVSYKTHDYEHGIKLTKAGKQRLRSRDFSLIKVPIPSKWDRKWRLVFFDIPVRQNESRHALTFKLKQLGFQQLQRSIWVHPFSCRPEVEAISEILKIRKFLTYIEITEIDAEDQLKLRFKKSLSKTTV